MRYLEHSSGALCLKTDFQVTTEAMKTEGINFPKYTKIYFEASNILRHMGNAKIVKYA